MFIIYNIFQYVIIYEKVWCEMGFFYIIARLCSFKSTKLLQIGAKSWERLPYDVATKLTLPSAIRNLSKFACEIYSLLGQCLNLIIKTYTLNN